MRIYILAYSGTHAYARRRLTYAQIITSINAQKLVHTHSVYITTLAGVTAQINPRPEYTQV